MSAYDPWPTAAAGWGQGYPPPARPARSPRAGWYALPATLLLLAAALIVTVVAVQWDQLTAADAGESAGPNTPGVSVDLLRDFRYEVYLEANPTESVGPGGNSICVLTPASGNPTTVAVLGGGGRAGDQIARDGLSYRYLGRFTAPLSGPARVSCAGGEGRLLVRPDDTPFLVLGVAVAGAAVLGVLALVAFLITLVLRSRRPPQPPYPPQYPPAYPQQYPPQQPYGPYPS